MGDQRKRAIIKAMIDGLLNIQDYKYSNILILGSGESATLGRGNSITEELYEKLRIDHEVEITGNFIQKMPISQINKYDLIINDTSPNYILPNMVLYTGLVFDITGNFRGSNSDIIIIGVRYAKNNIKKI